jgi:hypothetical protein
LKAEVMTQMGLFMAIEIPQLRLLGKHGFGAADLKTSAARRAASTQVRQRESQLRQSISDLPSPRSLCLCG